MNADEFNALYDVGVPVFAYPGARPEGHGDVTRLVTRTRSRASVLGGHTDVVWVDGYSACIALSHVDPVSEAEFKAAREAETAAPEMSGRERLRAEYIAALDEAHQTHPCPVLGDRTWSGCVHYDEAGRVVGVGACHSERRADAVLAVRDAEMEALRARVAEVGAAYKEALNEASALEGRLAEVERVPFSLDGADEPAKPDTLPAWLYQRFAVIHGAPAWDRITDRDRTCWEHHARAVRRAVERGGFKDGAR